MATFGECLTDYSSIATLNRTDTIFLEYDVAMHFHGVVLKVSYPSGAKVLAPRPLANVCNREVKSIKRLGNLVGRRSDRVNRSAALMALAKTDHVGDIRQ